MLPLYKLTMESLEEEIAQIEGAIEFICKRVPKHLLVPRIGIICGSGLGGIAQVLENRVSLLYSDLPGFASSTIPGHQGQLVFGTHEGIPIVCMVGRLHFYEGYPVHLIVRPIRVLASLGVRTLLITNAAGSLLPDQLQVGDFMVIEDHISFPILAGCNPLRGPNFGPGPRFLSTCQLYHPKSFETLCQAAKRAALPLDLIKRGVYCAVGGPSYETPAEIRLLRMVGGSAVGMSTVPEVLTAAHAGIPAIMAISVISNVCLPESLSNCLAGGNILVPPSHEEVLASTASSQSNAINLLTKLLPLLGDLQ